MNRGLVHVVLGSVLFATCAAVMAEQLHRWETATVLSQKLTSDSNTVAVITGAHSYVWQEVTRSPDWHHFIVLVHNQTVHDQMKFYRDGQWFVTLDDQGEKHTFRLIRAATNE
ncbi:MAG: hypothetical protein WBV28_10080 [Terracidiphilus sp.]